MIKLVGIRSSKRKLQSVILAVSTLCVAALLIYTNLLAPVDRFISQQRFQGADLAASGDIYFAGIDKQTIDDIGVWPWPRKHYAQIIDKLIASGVEEIAIDIDFSTPSIAVQDMALAKAIEAANGSVILPVFRQKTSLSDQDNHISISAPIPELARHAWLGNVNVFLEDDGRIWSFSDGQDADGSIIASMPSILAGHDGLAQQEVSIDYGLDIRTIPIISAGEIYAATGPITGLQGKKVVLGAFATELGDILPVPVHGALPGAMVQVLAAETLLAGRALMHLQSGLVLFVTLLLVAMAYKVWRVDIRILVVMTLSYSVAIELISYLLYLNFAWSVQTAATHGTLLALVCFRFIAMTSLFSTLARVARDDARKSRERVEYLSTHDESTGVLRKAAFLDECDRTIGKHKADFIIGVFRIASLDSISVVFGDKRTQRIIGKLVERTTHIDIHAEAVCRLDTSTFAVLFKQSDKMTIEALAERTQSQFSSPIEIDASEVVPVLQIGYALTKNMPIRSAEELLSNAQTAMLFAPKSKQRFSIYNSDIEGQIRRNAIIEGDLVGAVSSNAVKLKFQPIVDVQTDQTVCFEVLARWNHPELGYVSPEEFINIAEAVGFVTDLDLMMLKRACNAAINFPESISVSVNVSPIALASQSYARNVVEHLERSGIDPRRLTLEILETVAIDTSEHVDANIEALRRHGIVIALDDFGTGNAGLENLTRLQFDKVKLDKVFTQNIADSRTKRAILQATRKLCDAFDVQMICEGIENEQDLAFVKSLGCDFGQGYLFGKPMSFAEAIAICEMPEQTFHRKAS